MSTIRWHQDADGVVVLTLDDPTGSANTMSEAFVRSLVAALDRLESRRDGVTGVIVASAKKTFLAGGNLNELLAVRKQDAAAFAAGVRRIKAQLRRLETLGRPVVAAINGAALGGGLEVALACHHRIVVDDARAVVGFPEVQLGLLPGGGGIVRSVRLLGVAQALQGCLLHGQRLQPADAQALGLVDEIVATNDDLLPAAKAWISVNPQAVQPWDVDGHGIPGGTPATPSLVRQLPALPASLRKQLKGANYPAPAAIMAAAVEGAQVDFENAIDIEERYFVSLVTGQIAKNMIQGCFFDLRSAKHRPGGRAGSDLEPFAPRKAVVLGAGMMGAAIAYVCAKAGIDVVLKDVSLEAARRGKRYSDALVAKSVEKGRTTPRDGEALLARIVPTDDNTEATGADLVIEAVFEDPGIKAQVLADIEPHLAPDALLGTNTSTLPITDLAESVSRPAAFIGLHFFSPVDKMPLLEVIKGKQTTDETVHRALELAKRIGKTPIVVNDSRGFFTSRVIMTFIHEGMAMLAEGVAAATIEQASSQAGYPAPVLQLADELNLELIAKIREENRAAGTWVPHPADEVIDRMLGEGRPGRVAGAGFHEYGDGRRVRLWPGLVEVFGATGRDVDLVELQERLLFAEALEAIRCLEQGVLESVADANVGSLLGIGFPGWTGGVLQYANGYDGGTAGFASRAGELAAQHGARFEPPALLIALAERGAAFGD